MLNEMFPLLPDERYGVRREQDVLGVLGDVCLDGFVGVGQDLQAVLGVLVCAGGGSVVPRHPAARWLGDTRRTGGVRTLDGPATLSAERGRRRSGATSTRLRGNVMGISVDGWLCCVVLCCVVFVLCSVGLCCVCVVLSCVVLGCVVLC